MQEIYVEQIGKVLQNKKKLESELEIKITNQGKNLFVDGDTDKEFTAIQLMEAINLGFSIEKALLLKDENIILQTIHIKDITKRHDLERVRARIIGTQGKTLKTLDTLTNCEFSLQDNQIGIIGDTEDIEEAIQAVTSLIQGSKQANVYAHAEKEIKKKRLNPKV
jgi:ribosomal RNA assembly protein